MDPNLQTALLLMLVGMLVVFAVLALIVGSGKLLIRLVNRFSTGERPGRLGTYSQARDRDPDPATLAALMAAVEVVSEGKGRIQHIEKLA